MGTCRFYIGGLYNLYSAHARGAPAKGGNQENEHRKKDVNQEILFGCNFEPCVFPTVATILQIEKPIIMRVHNSCDCSTD